MKKTIHSEAQKTFCEMLRAARKKQMITQTELSVSLGRPQSFVAKIERGERRLDVIEFLHYAAALDASRAKILEALRKKKVLWK